MGGLRDLGRQGDDRPVRPRRRTARTARRNWGADVSATGSGASSQARGRLVTGDATAALRAGHDTTGPPAARLSPPPRSSAPRRPGPRRRGLGSVAEPPGDSCGSLPPVRDIGDHRVSRPTSAPRAAGGLVVEEPVPPVARDVLGQDHDRGGRLLLGWPGPVQDVQVRTTGPNRARYGDSTITSGTPGNWRSQRARNSPPSPRGRRS